MNAAQISALSQIQAQAIVNARPSTALIAAGITAKNAKPTPQQIQNQIQLQAQALVHAHTQAQIAADIYKGGDAPKNASSTPASPTSSTSAAAAAASSTAVASSQSLSSKPAAKVAPPTKPAAKPVPPPVPALKPAPIVGKMPAPVSAPVPPPAPVQQLSSPPAAATSAAAASGDSSILPSITPSQLAQQNQVSAKHAADEEAISKRHATELSSFKSRYQAQNLASSPTSETSAAQENEMKKLMARHEAEIKEAKDKAAREMADLHATFRKQNAAAEYAGLRVATVPNPTTESASTPAPMTSSPAAAAPSSVQVPAPTLAASATPGGIAPMDVSGSPLDDDSGPVCSATSPEFLNKLGALLQGFWTDQLREMRELGTTKTETEHDFKNHNDLPLARIKRIMKSDEDVRMISAEAPVLFAKAVEMFILELSLRSWAYSENNKRRTLQKEDIKEAIQRTDIFDFLVDVIH